MSEGLRNRSPGSRTNIDLPGGFAQAWPPASVAQQTGGRDDGLGPPSRRLPAGAQAVAAVAGAGTALHEPPANWLRALILKTIGL
ncbi:hypothetical protein [Nonomuraea sp. NPDC003754]